MNTMLVSAFFDIGRKNSRVSGMKRGNQEYFDYFKFWAGLQNELIVYTQPQFVDKIKKIRNSFGLEEKTTVVSVEDITEIEPEIYEKMQRIEGSGNWSKLRLNMSAMSNQCRYDYVMFLKYWCLDDAVKRSGFNGVVVWMDFGFSVVSESP